MYGIYDKKELYDLNSKTFGLGLNVSHFGS